MGFSSLTNYIIVINMLDLQVDRISNTTQFLYNYFNNSLLSFLFLLKISSPFPQLMVGLRLGSTSELFIILQNYHISK